MDAALGFGCVVFKLFFFLFEVLGDSKYVTSLYFPAILVGLTIESRFVVGRRD